MLRLFLPTWVQRTPWETMYAGEWQRLLTNRLHCLRGLDRLFRAFCLSSWACLLHPWMPVRHLLGPVAAALLRRPFFLSCRLFPPCLLVWLVCLCLLRPLSWKHSSHQGSFYSVLAALPLWQPSVHVSVLAMECVLLCPLRLFPFEL